MNFVENINFYNILLEDGIFDYYLKYRFFENRFRPLHYNCDYITELKLFDNTFDKVDMLDYIPLDDSSSDDYWVLGILWDYFPKKYFECCELLYNSRRRKVQRLKKKIERMIAFGDCVFLTLSFDDDSLSSLSAKTRRDYVGRALNVHDLYIANIDFGAKNGREHYHALVTGRFDFNRWSCGGVYAEQVRSNSTSIQLAKYIDKFANHAVKSSTGSSRLIFSKNFQKLL